MKPEKMIELLKGMQSPVEDYAELVGAPAFTYGHKYVYPYPEDYAIEEAIEALKEVQQYREIGTVEECREAVEKQKAKKCDVTKDNFRIYYKCPTCNHCLRVEYNHGSWMGKKSKNCSKCGQAIQWDKNLEGMEDERD